MLRSVARRESCMAAGTSLRTAVRMSTTSAAVDGDVRARADGDADVRAGERRRVVDAVADHGDASLRALRRRISRSLPSGSTPAITSSTPASAPDGPAPCARCRP